MNLSLIFFSLVWTMALLWMTLANRSLFTFDFMNLFWQFSYVLDRLTLSLKIKLLASDGVTINAD